MKYHLILVKYGRLSRYHLFSMENIGPRRHRTAFTQSAERSLQPSYGHCLSAPRRSGIHLQVEYWHSLNKGRRCIGDAI